MSQSAATTARPARRPVPQRPTLQLVTPVARASSNLPFVLLCSFVLAAGLIAVLFLNMQLSAGSYEMDRLQKRSALAADQEAKLREELAVESATGKLAQRATSQGMVPGVAAMFLSLPDGKILGVAPKEAAKDPLTVVGDAGTPVKPGENPTAKPGEAASNQPTATPTNVAGGAPSPASAGEQAPRAPQPTTTRQGSAQPTQARPSTARATATQTSRQ
ncbi:MAG: hypothetical protein IPK37_00315 [Austwickia sp.]|jgi:hypothetical protein|nr:MAG: hypothetical protein IPK37_00315 [Austwickia sp.]